MGAWLAARFRCKKKTSLAFFGCLLFLCHTRGQNKETTTTGDAPPSHPLPPTRTLRRLVDFYTINSLGTPPRNHKNVPFKHGTRLSSSLMWMDHIACRPKFWRTTSIHHHQEPAGQPSLQ